MMKLRCLILFFLLVSSRCLCGQEYDRSSVSLILIDYKDTLQKQVYHYFSCQQIGERYDKNKIATDRIIYSGSREYKTKNTLTGKLDFACPDQTGWLTKNLNEENIGLQVVGSIFNRQENGLMDMEIVNQRAAYNKTDEEYRILQATVKNIAGLREGGEELIRNSYIMVYDFPNLRLEYTKNAYSEEDYYWKSTPTVYLFRVDFTDELRDTFYEECWIDTETPETERAARRERFATFRIPVKFVMRYKESKEVKTGLKDFLEKSKKDRGNVTENDLKTNALGQMVRQSFADLNEQIETGNEAFQVKAVVCDVKPVRAKIGLKEGVKSNHRYFMYEYRQRRDGEEVKCRMGIIRSTNHITDNREVTSGNTTPTEFYQIAGRQAQPGWDIVEKRGLGFNLEAGYQMGNLNGVDFGITTSFYGGRSLNHYLMFDFIYGLDKYEIEQQNKHEVKKLEYNLLTMNLGYGYGLMKRNWELYPYLGAGAYLLMDHEKEDKSTANSSSAKDETGDFMDKTAWTFNCGIRATVNICYPVQLFGGVEYSTDFYKGKVYDTLLTNKDLDKATSGVHYKFGLRYCF